MLIPMQCISDPSHGHRDIEQSLAPQLTLLVAYPLSFFLSILSCNHSHGLYALVNSKNQFSFQSQRKAMPKNVQTTAQVAVISHASKVMLKILQARLQQ